jgi:hypothetical protein
VMQPIKHGKSIAHHMHDPGSYPAASRSPITDSAQSATAGGSAARRVQRRMQGPAP